MPSSKHRGRRPSRSDTPGRGHFSISALGKRRRNAEEGAAESGGEPRARGRGRGRPHRARGRPRGGGMIRESVAAAHKSSTTSNTGKTGPHHPGFSQHLFDHNILPLVHFWRDGERPSPPENMREIETYLSTARTSEPAENFQRFQSLYEQVSGEDDAVNLLDTLQGDRLALAQSQVILQKKQLNNLEPLTDGSIPSGCPDRAYGARSKELDKDVRKELEGTIVPTREKDVICPNFVVHVKSDKGDVLVARIQAAYDGALAARGMQSLWNFGNQPDSSPEGQRQESDGGRSTGDVGAPLDTSLGPARVARTITCTWAVGVLKMYATYCEDTGSDPAPEFPRYIPSLIGSWVMTDKENQFREGLAAYRNGLDWAKAQRDEVISRANERIRAEKANGRHRDRNQGSEEGDGDPGPSCAGRAPVTREHDEGEGNSEAEDEDNGEADDQQEAEDSDPGDVDIYNSFDSQRTITPRTLRPRIKNR